MIKAGAQDVKWSEFQDCSDTKKVVWIENGIEHVIGTTMEVVIIDREQDRLFRKQELVFSDPKKGKRIVNLTLKLSSFEPLTCKDESQKVITITYRANDLEMKIDDGESNTTQIHGIPEGTLDLFSIELILRLLPLEVGYENELHAFIHMANDTKLVKLEVEELEKVSNGIEEVDAYRVQVYLGENLQTYWLSKETKELLKQSVKIGEATYFDFVR